jgi:hypothetical protein
MDRWTIIKKKGLLFLILACFVSWLVLMGDEPDERNPLEGFSIGLRVFFDYA